MTQPAPGPLADEAARLAEAIGDWARGAFGDAAPAAGSGPEHAAGTGPECQICPLCQLLALIRRTQPETFGHLAQASASMIAALRTIVESHDHGRQRPSGVEHIDLDGETP